MSMFKTLQSSPATITIFHNNKVALSSKLFGILTKANDRLNQDKTKILVDLMENTLPTYDQYDIIAHNCLKDNYSKNALKSCFPFLGGKQEFKVGQDRTTIKSPLELGRLSSNGMKLFNEAEYGVIVDAFTKIQDQPDTGVDVLDIFLPPLVVDWDQNLIANDEFGINGILKKYLEN